MYRLIVALALTFLLAPSGLAQARGAECRVRFTVVQREDNGALKLQPDDRDAWGRWPADAKEWWTKDGSRKYKEMCEADRDAAQFLLVWARQTITKNFLEIVGTNRRPVYRTVCDPPVRGASRGACREVVSYYQESLVTEGRDRRLDQVSLTLYRSEKEPQQFVPLSSLSKEVYPYGAGKAAIESGLKAVRKEVRKKRR